MTHTPGPWRSRNRETLARARLASAAPQLLNAAESAEEFLSVVLHFFDEGKLLPDAPDKVRKAFVDGIDIAGGKLAAAIAKAKQIENEKEPTRGTTVSGQHFHLTDDEIIELAKKTHPDKIDGLKMYLETHYDGDLDGEYHLMGFDLDGWREDMDTPPFSYESNPW
jgi:hypothetical protein